MSKKNLFISNLGWKHYDFEKILKLLKKYNIKGIDIAPIQLSNKWKNIEEKLKKFQKKLKKSGIKVNAMQGIFYKTNFNLFNSDNAQKTDGILFRIIKINFTSLGFSKLWFVVIVDMVLCEVHD